MMRAVLATAAVAAYAGPLGAQRPPSDSLATLRVTVLHDSLPVEGAIVRAVGGAAAQADARGLATLRLARGLATLRLAPGPRAVVASRLGFRPDTLRLTLRAGQDTAVVARLVEEGAEVEAFVVTATRGERRVEDTPTRVEVVDEEEIAEKVAMTPGDVAMLLNETSGLRVQSSSPSLGGASVRVQGLSGRYTLVLADGLPLYGAQATGLGILQIPPVDLGRVEIIKGTASALYGGAALGGVINLVSRRPSETPERTLLVNGTSRGGADGVFFGAGPLAGAWRYTLLAGAHAQRRNDVDDDGWADLPGYERAVVRPRLYWDDGAGRTAFLTAGVTAEDRRGGTLPGRVVPSAGGGAFVESLRTRRADVAGLARWVVPNEEGTALRGAILTARGSATAQRHAHGFGDARERDRHGTLFGETAIALPRHGSTWVAGAAVQRDAYRARDVRGVDYTHVVPALFAQVDVDPAPWLSATASARADRHNVYGTVVSPRLSLLLRRPAAGALAGWTARLSGGAGASWPTPLTEETEAGGLAHVVPPSGLVAERARSASLDVGGPLATPLGTLEVNATAFGSRVRRPLLARAAPPSAGSAVPRLTLANATLPTATWGTDAFARLRVDDVLAGELGLIATYVFLRSTEEDPERGGRRATPLTPRHSAGFDAIWEREGAGRFGLELFYTGRQPLDDDPYRDESRPYVLVGVLAEWRVGRARLFVNAENIGGVRQTRWDPLVRPARAPGGRWSTDAWTETAGATVNGGVRVTF